MFNCRMNTSAPPLFTTMIVPISRKAVLPFANNAILTPSIIIRYTNKTITSGFHTFSASRMVRRRFKKLGQCSVAKDAFSHSRTSCNTEYYLSNSPTLPCKSLRRVFVTSDIALAESTIPKTLSQIPLKVIQTSHKRQILTLRSCCIGTATERYWPCSW